MGMTDALRRRFRDAVCVIMTDNDEGLCAIGLDRDLVRARDGFGKTLMLIATGCGSTRCLLALHAAGADLEATETRTGTGMVFKAASAGDARTLAVLLDLGARPDGADGTAFTPLMAAAFCGSLECVSALVGAGANVNARDPRDGQTPFTCVQPRAMRVARYLREHGADVEAVDSEGLTGACRGHLLREQRLRPQALRV